MFTVLTNYSSGPWPYRDMSHQKWWSERRVLSATMKWHILYAHNQQEASYYDKWALSCITGNECIWAIHCRAAFLWHAPIRYLSPLWQHVLRNRAGCYGSVTRDLARACACADACINAWSHVSNVQKQDECNSSFSRIETGLHLVPLVACSLCLSFALLRSLPGCTSPGGLFPALLITPFLVIKTYTSIFRFSGLIFRHSLSKFFCYRCNDVLVLKNSWMEINLFCLAVADFIHW